MRENEEEEEAAALKVNNRKQNSQQRASYVEVLCTSSRKVRRFAVGTDSRFALNLINQKLGNRLPLASHIEAVKPGEEEEPISFGPNALLVDYGSGWKLQTVALSQGFRKWEDVQETIGHGTTVQGVEGSHDAKSVSQPAISLSYIGKILLAFLLIFVLGAFLTLALESLPALILYINSRM